jgi:hypothetical protein
MGAVIRAKRLATLELWSRRLHFVIVTLVLLTVTIQGAWIYWIVGWYVGNALLRWLG